MKTNRIRLLLSALLVCVGVTTLGLAQKADEPKGEKKDRSRTRSSLNIKPSPNFRAVVPIKGFERTVRIHEADQSEGNEGLYCHRPLFAFLESRESVGDELPTIVMKRRLLADGTTRLEFKVQLTTPAFRHVAEDEVRKQDIDRIKRMGRLDQVRVIAWPMTHAAIDCEMNGSVLASGETKSLNSGDETMPFALAFTPENLKQFKEGVKTGDVTFTFFYTFENRVVAEGRVSTDTVKSIGTIVNQKLALRLTPQQRDGTMPIFQRQVNAIEREVRADVLKTVRATHKDILPLLDTSNSLVGRFFELNKEITMEELDGDKALKDQVYRYMAPLVNSVVNAKQVDVKNTDEDETTVTDVDKSSVGFGIKIPIYSVEVGTDVKVESGTTKVKRNLLKNEYGITLKEDSTKQFYVPASIRVLKMARLDERATFAESTTAFLAIGQSDEYLEDTPIPANYTLAAVEKQFGSVSEARFYDGVPLGTILPYLGTGDQPPHGYVWADGKSEWPSDSWIPQHLRGKKVPDMSGQLIGGATGFAKVGTHWTEGQLDYSVTVDARNFKLPATKVGKSPGNFWALDKGPGNLVGSNGPIHVGEGIQRTGVPAAGILGIKDFGAVHAQKTDFPAPSEFASEALQGSTTVPGTIKLESVDTLPRHLRCRWIIRVR